MKTYKVAEVCAFSRAADKWGEFGNMSGGFPLRIFKDVLVPSSENLYQMMRFPHHPEIQQEILDQKSGMGAKMVAKKYRATKTHPAFEENKVTIMLWCLFLKAAQHKKFREVLLETDDRDIVEISKKDDFWGAKFNDDKTLLIGQNELGIQLMSVRDIIKRHDNRYKIKQQGTLEFKLLGREIPEFDYTK